MLWFYQLSGLDILGNKVKNMFCGQLVVFVVAVTEISCLCCVVVVVWCLYLLSDFVLVVQPQVQVECGIWERCPALFLFG